MTQFFSRKKYDTGELTQKISNLLFSVYLLFKGQIVEFCPHLISCRPSISNADAATKQS